MKHLFGNLKNRLLGASGSSKKLNSKIIHLPDDLLNPDGFLVYSGSGESDVWPALFIANTLQKEFPDRNLSVICSNRDNALFNMLRLRPSIHSYDKHPMIPDTLEADSLTAGTILVYPYTSVHIEAQRVLSGTSCGIRLAPLTHSSPFINLMTKNDADAYPEILIHMCDSIGLKYDTDFRPSVPAQIEKAAEKIMAPTSGRMLPYIATTSSALSILEKRRTEIPLRTVSLSGRNSSFNEMERELKTAIIAGASAVATDSDVLWGDACAHGVPVVGLDQSSSFIRWNGIEPSSDENEFADAWIRLLKKGW